MLGGVVTLALGGTLAAVGTTHMAQSQVQGLAICALAFALIGLGVSAAGTSLLTLMSKRVPESMRAPAATTVWVMMIMGFAITAVTVGKLIEPYSPQRLIDVTAGLGLVIVLITSLALWGLESGTQPVSESSQGSRLRNMGDFRQALSEVWQDPQARLFTLFVFLSMLAYSSQDLVLEPFAGAIFGMSPGETTQLSGVHHSGVLIGMADALRQGSGDAAEAPKAARRK